VSTIKKLAGKQYTMMRDKRVDVLNFYGRMTRTPRLPRPVFLLAKTIYLDLLRIHRSSTLNSLEKDNAFRRYLKRAETAGRLGEDAAAAPVIAPGSDPVGAG
jgi:hypothetical protein